MNMRQPFCWLLLLLGDRSKISVHKMANVRAKCRKTSPMYITNVHAKCTKTESFLVLFNVIVTSINDKMAESKKLVKNELKCPHCETYCLAIKDASCNDRFLWCCPHFRRKIFFVKWQFFSSQVIYR